MIVAMRHAVLLVPFLGTLLLFGGEKKSGKEEVPTAAIVVPGFELINVTVTSIPSGARVEVERMPAGRTAAVIKLQPGEYRLRLTLAGYDPWEQRVAVR